MVKRKVLLTGACGYVSGRMLHELREKYDLTLLDVKTTDTEGEEVERKEKLKSNWAQFHRSPNRLIASIPWQRFIRQRLGDRVHF